MPTMMAALGLDKLTAEQKRQLASELERDLAEEGAPLPFSPSGLTEAQRAELHHRLEDIEQHPDDWVPWNEVRAEVQRRYLP